MNNLKLNLGCCCFKLPHFVNIDIDPQFKPDKCMDLMELEKEFSTNSVDFILAGHIFEHFKKEDSQELMRQCGNLLKPFRMLLTIVPDYTKCADLHISAAEKIILAGGDHQMLFNAVRMRAMLKKAGFTNVFEIKDLTSVPYLVVPDIKNPVPDPWQTAFLSFKVF